MSVQRATRCTRSQATCGIVSASALAPILAALEPRTLVAGEAGAAHPSAEDSSTFGARRAYAN